MNILRRSTCRWSSALVAAAIGLGASSLAGQEKRKLPSFLEEFKSITDPEIVAREIEVPGIKGTRAYLARPDTKERLPGVLLIGDADGRQAWYRLNAREISSIGYVVLAVEPVKDLMSALAWLRKRDDVLPGQLGVVGWGRGGEEALRLAATEALQACVTCDGLLANEQIAALKTPVLAVCARLDGARAQQIEIFRKAVGRSRSPLKIHEVLGVRPGFMGPPGTPAYSEKEAEEAWLEIYEFLGKHVEDTTGPVDGRAGGIGELMRAVNSPAGLRGTLIRALEKEPANEASWKEARALAAMIAEGAGILERLRPPRGAWGQWQEQARTFREHAQKLVHDTERRDFKAARQALDSFGNRCAVCHKHHR